MEHSDALSRAAPAAADLLGIHGLTPGGLGIWTLVLLALIAIVHTLVRQRPSMRKLQIDADASLRTDLLGEIAKLRTEATDQRRECDRELTEQRRHFDTEMQEMRRRHDEEMHGMKLYIDGLHKQMTQFQATVATAMPLAATAPIATARARELAAHADDTLTGHMTQPGVGE